jgi:hypothetical protein
VFKEVRKQVKGASTQRNRLSSAGQKTFVRAKFELSEAMGTHKGLNRYDDVLG